MSRFQKIYLRQLIIFNIGATITAAAFWSDDFTLTRLTLNFIQSLLWAFVWAKLEINGSKWVNWYKPKPPAVKPDEKPVWPPVVDRKDNG